MTCLRLAFIVLIVVPAIPAAAQEHYAQFIPLAPGNEWQFMRAYGTDPPSGVVERFVVTGDTLLGSDVYSVYERTSFSTTGEAFASYLCAARTRAYANQNGDSVVTADVVPLGDSEHGDCSYQDCFPQPIVPLRIVEDASTISIGGRSYVVESTIRSGSGGQGPGGYSTGQWCYNALHIGPYLCTYEVNDEIQRRTILQYVEVGGEVYGASAVNTEATIPPSAFFSVTAYPNPFTSELRLTIPTAGGSVMIEFLDVLGRTILERDVVSFRGKAPVVVLPVPHNFPPGLYIIQVSSPYWSETISVTKI